MIRKILLTILTIFAIWVSGFAYYLYTINFYKLNNYTTNAIIVFAGGGHKIETGIALLKAGYAPILFITGIETSDQIKNLLKEYNVLEQQVILAPNEVMSEEDYIKKASDFILKHNITSVRLVTYNYEMPFIINKLAAAISYSNNINIIPNPVSSNNNYITLLKNYNYYLLSL